MRCNHYAGYLFELFNGWIVCELRQVENRVVNVPISVPYETEDKAIQAMYTMYDIREKLHLL